MSKKRKIIILSCMILLLAVTAVFNFVLSGTASTTTAAVTYSNYFTQYKSERTASRSEQILLLDDTIKQAEKDSETYKNALDMKLKLTAIMEKELFLEKLIQAQGYTDSVVSVGLTSDTINVIVNGENFDQDDAIIIYTILKEEANATPDQVKIRPIS